MSRQRKVVITMTYNDLGIIVDTKAEELDLSAQQEPHWIPCTVINQCYIPELKDVDYKGVLFTYETITGKRLVKIAWVERGRIIGKQMKGTPVAYKLLPEPYNVNVEGQA